ncbi:MAG TPA: hypothetical protein VJS13_00815 [Pyrinomonadaceae bacterium]|nr:hypothetical protein [Pyrinomonadaceae bacterium]
MRILPLRLFLCSLVILVASAAAAVAQSSVALPKKLPSVEKIVDSYLKAIGGKKAVAAQRDATYEWIVELNGPVGATNQSIGTGRTLRKAPASERFELTFGNGQIISGTNPRSAWEIGLDNRLRTLTSLEAATAKLQTTLAASRLIDFKKSNVLARVLSLGDLASEPAYIVEFSTRAGARVHYYFSIKTKLITKITSDAKKTRLFFEDYRSENGLLEPHRMRMSLDGSGELTLVLKSVKYNTGIDDQLFDPPGATEKLDITSLLLEVASNQDATENRVAEYSFKQTETDREINSKGELKKQTVKVYEVYPLPNRVAVVKLISENGVPLSAERAAKEDKRVQDEFVKAERDKEKDEQEAAKRKAEREKKKKNDDDADPTISMFLRACDFVSPRRERFEGRESIVFDFRPRAGFKPKTREESLITKLVGVMWIDPVDKQVMRLEARLAEGFKIAGGLVASLKPGAGIVMEQTRMEQGVWLPRFAQINLSVKVLLFAGGDFNKTIEWSDFKHFSGDVKDYKIEAPASVKP